MRGCVHPVFDAIDWGRSDVLKRTTAHATRLGIAYELLEPLRDLDTESDLRAWQSAVREGEWLDQRP